MPEVKLTLERYRKDSIVFIEGKRSNTYFYIIKEGRAKTSRQNMIEGELEANVLKPGDTFGVVSSMAHRPRIETVTALTDLTVIKVASDQFIDLLRNNAPIALKIIRSFSKKLRNFCRESLRP